MSLFKSKHNESVPSEIHGWEEFRHSSLALKWAKFGGQCKPWERLLKAAEPLDLLKCIQKLFIEKRKEMVGL